MNYSSADYISDIQVLKQRYREAFQKTSSRKIFLVVQMSKESMSLHKGILCRRQQPPLCRQTNTVFTGHSRNYTVTPPHSNHQTDPKSFQGYLTKQQRHTLVQVLAASIPQSSHQSFTSTLTTKI